MIENFQEHEMPLEAWIRIMQKMTRWALQRFDGVFDIKQLLRGSLKKKEKVSDTYTVLLLGFDCYSWKMKSNKEVSCSLFKL
jgi:hypothetical protein